MISTKRGRVGAIDYIDIETRIDNERLSMAKLIYKQIDKEVIENMPQDILEELQKLVNAELEDRELDSVNIFNGGR